MRHNSATRLAVLLLLLALGCAGGVCVAEMSVDKDPSAGAKSLVLMYALLAGGDDGAPWPIMRSHIPSAWLLNPGGSNHPLPDGWPSLGWDPISNSPEVVWARHDGDDYEIVISRWTTDHWTTPLCLTANTADDLDPEIAYAPDGTARLTYWNSAGVFLLTRTPGGDWGVAEPVDSGERSSVAGTSAMRVAYQRDPAESPAEIVAAERIGGWLPVVLATTEFGGFDDNGELDVRLEAQGGKVWVAWEHSSTDLGWCELLSGGSWSVPAYEPVPAPGDEEAARLRIKLKAIH